MDALGGLVALVLFVGLALVGGLLVTSHAVLISERPGELYSGFACNYFTGTRQVNIVNYSQTGCPRFIKVGE